MAEIPYQIDGLVVRWVGVEEGDTCRPVPMRGIWQVTVAVHGVMGSASVAVRVGALNDELSTGLLANFLPLKDIHTGNAVALTTTNTGAIGAEAGIWYQPVITSATGTTNLSITLTGQ